MAKSNVTAFPAAARKGIFKGAETKTKTKVGLTVETPPKKSKATKMGVIEVDMVYGEPKVNSHVYRGDKDDAIQSIYLMKSALPDAKNAPKRIRITIEALD